LTVRVEREPAFVLHTRDYRETSLIVEVFTRHYGRLGLIAKGAKRPKSGQRGVLRPFQPLLVSWMGKGELATLTGTEAAGASLGLTGQSMFCGFYVNELLMRLLHRHDAHENLFDVYGSTLRELKDDPGGERTLRLFEKHLLRELGYALILDREAGSSRPISPDCIYRYDPERGPVPAGEGRDGVQVRGATLLALDEGTLADPDDLRELKHLMRSVLAVHLGGKPLHSRRLFHRRKTA
jgi:DNA repair protein RecO (recombination protein O)